MVPNGTFPPAPRAVRIGDFDIIRCDRVNVSVRPRIANLYEDATENHRIYRYKR